ncbi:MAG TPA: sugar phosphate isomerase [Armatimonadetes bacterium]|jgi:sugar phosphate isomerase/epimerase|nr:sugar phosphate isomerase [Armatimonadota bacterium]
MRIGYLCRYSDSEIAFAKQAGFGSIQLLIWPGDPLDPTITSADEVLRARDKYAEAGIEVSALGCYVNQLDADEATARRNVEYFRLLYDVAEQMGVDTIGAFAGRNPELDIPENIPLFESVWTEGAAIAEDRGLRIAFENCPMFHYFPFRGVNIAYTPRAWELMFEAVPSPALGLEYDPSHLVCLLIDYLQVIHDWGERIYHVHAKDAEIDWRAVRRNGILEPGAVRHRTPGMGVVKWSEVISALVEVGYEGNLDIEGRHDPVYHGARENEGLVISLRHLEQFVKPEWVAGG